MFCDDTSKVDSDYSVDVWKMSKIPEKPSDPGRFQSASQLVASRRFTGDRFELNGGDQHELNTVSFKSFEDRYGTAFPPGH